MATFTYTKPTVGGSEDTWGTTLNANWDALGTFLGSLDSAELAVLDGITSSTAELNLLDGVTVTLADITSTAAELNLLDGVTATTAEINYLSGVTGAIQTQIDNIPTAVELTQAQVEDDTSTVFGQVSGERLNQSVNANLGAFAAGAVGAPPILVNALGVFTAGTTRRYYSTAEYTTTSNSYVTAFNRSIGGRGTLRVKFDWKNDAAAGNGSARILVNGVQVAIFSSTSSFVTTSTDVTLTAGSVLKIEHSGFNGTTTIKNIELLTNGEEIMFIADQEGVTFG